MDADDDMFKYVSFVSHISPVNNGLYSFCCVHKKIYQNPLVLSLQKSTSLQGHFRSLCDNILAARFMIFKLPSHHSDLI